MQEIAEEQGEIVREVFVDFSVFSFLTYSRQKVQTRIELKYSKLFLILLFRQELLSREKLPTKKLEKNVW